MVASLREDVLQLKAADIVPQNVDAFEVPGHTLRRSGARHLARKGVPLDLIKYMARHSSDAIHGYVEEALEESPVADTKQKSSEVVLKSFKENWLRRSATLPSRIASGILMKRASDS